MAIPKSDEKLVPYGSNFTTVYSADPITYGGTAASATALTAAFTAYQTAVTAMNDARANGTRSKQQTTSRTELRTAFVELVRPIYSYVQGSGAISDTDKVALGVHVRDAHPTPVPQPSQTPAVNIVSVTGRTVEVRIYDNASTTRRAKAAGAEAAWVYTFVGANYPSDPSLWQFNGAATKDKFTIDFASTLAGGTQVWVTAAWVNAKGEAGPIAVPISTTLQGGGSSSASELKIAA
jgi:hypothetical protein